MKRTISILLAAVLCLALFAGIPFRSAEAAGTKYRALLVGETLFGSETALRNRSDVIHMSEMLSSVTGPTGEKFDVQTALNTSYNALKSLISSTFKSATENDISLFFIATHGDSEGDGDLVLTDGSYYYWLDFATLANWLNTYVKGKVIVILESCGSGSAVYANGADETEQADTFDAEAFNQKAINAFRAYETRAGELRDSKFYVLTAAAHHQDSWGYEGYYSGNYFTDWLVEGVGSDDRMPADTNNDCIVTLNELYKHIAQHNTDPITYQGVDYYQEVQVYPENRSFPMFRRGGDLVNWVKSNGKWYCYDKSNKMLKGWQKINGTWFYFDKNGVLQTGWLLDAGKWYYLEPMPDENTFDPYITGSIFTDGWRMVDGRWYYFNPGGHIARNTWKEIENGSGNWYYFSDGGQMVTGWQKLNGSWYLFNPGGTLVTGWRKSGQYWYYLGTGAMRTGWQKLGGKWYYFRTASENPEGAMVTGTYTIKGVTYVFDENGVWVS